MLSGDPLPLVSILVVTWNRRDDVVRSVRSAQAQTYPRTEIVVVDNGSADGTAELLTSRFPGVCLVRLPQNVGCPSGRNVGFGRCGGAYVYQLDDDGWLEPDAVERAVLRAETDDRIGVVMSQIWEGEEGGAVRPRWPWPSPRFISQFSGGCSMIRRAALEAAGPYPDDFFRQGEEADLALRLYDAGYSCVFEPSSIMHHRPNPRGRSANAILRYTLRNANRTGMRLWPMPWCALRPLVTAAHAVREAVARRDWALPGALARELLRDLRTLPRTRRPVSRGTYRLFCALQARPAERISLRGATRTIRPMPGSPDAKRPAGPEPGPAGLAKIH